MVLVSAWPKSEQDNIIDSERINEKICCHNLLLKPGSRTISQEISFVSDEQSLKGDQENLAPKNPTSTVRSKLGQTRKTVK